MRRAHIIVGTVTFALLTTTATARADVQVGIHIGVPAPPAIAFQAPPRLVMVPGVPHVHYAPDVAVNFFSYGDRYYTYDEGNWFVAGNNRGPWGYVEQRHVPGPLLRVPNRYYHVPPRLVGGGHWYGKNKSHHRGGKKWKSGKHHRGQRNQRGGRNRDRDRSRDRRN